MKVTPRHDRKSRILALHSRLDTAGVEKNHERVFVWTYSTSTPTTLLFLLLAAKGFRSKAPPQTFGVQEFWTIYLKEQVVNT